MQTQCNDENTWLLCAVCSIIRIAARNVSKNWAINIRTNVSQQWWKKCLVLFDLWKGILFLWLLYSSTATVCVKYCKHTRWTRISNDWAIFSFKIKLLKEPIFCSSANIYQRFRCIKSQENIMIVFIYTG